VQKETAKKKKIVESTGLLRQVFTESGGEEKNGTTVAESAKGDTTKSEKRKKESEKENPTTRDCGSCHPPKTVFWAAGSKGAGRVTVTVFPLQQNNNNKEREREGSSL
jgi:hypothetical protein